MPAAISSSASACLPKPEPEPEEIEVVLTFPTVGNGPGEWPLLATKLAEYADLAPIWRCVPLPTLKPEAAKRRHRPTLPRSLDAIEVGLLVVLKRLAKGQEPWPLFLFGDVGTGKTCAALGLADRVAGATWFKTTRDLCNDLRAASNGPWVHDFGDLISERRYWKRIDEAALAILDELGTRDKASDFERENVQQFFDVREGVDDSGRYADFHALRHTFVSWLARANVTPMTAQTLARHSEINLNLTRYAHVGVFDQASAVQLLPSIPGTGSDCGESAAGRATGTDGRAVDIRTQKMVPSMVPRSAKNGAVQASALTCHSSTSCNDRDCHCQDSDNTSASGEAPGKQGHRAA